MQLRFSPFVLPGDLIHFWEGRELRCFICFSFYFYVENLDFFYLCFVGWYIYFFFRSSFSLFSRDFDIYIFLLFGRGLRCFIYFIHFFCLFVFQCEILKFLFVFCWVFYFITDLAFPFWRGDIVFLQGGKEDVLFNYLYIFMFLSMWNLEFSVLRGWSCFAWDICLFLFSSLRNSEFDSFHGHWNSFMLNFFLNCFFYYSIIYSFICSGKNGYIILFG